MKRGGPKLDWISKVLVGGQPAQPSELPRAREENASEQPRVTAPRVDGGCSPLQPPMSALPFQAAGETREPGDRLPDHRPGW